MSIEHVTKFYRAFAARDWETMANAYARDARFSDPVFQTLKGSRIGAMWQMLLERATDLEISFKGARQETSQIIAADWEAKYTFTATKRKVHNRVHARFQFRDGEIAQHDDTFDLYAWTRMALGPVGVALGWSPLIQGKVRRQALNALDDFVEKLHPSTSSGRVRVK